MQPSEGIVTTSARHSVDDTVKILEQIMQENGITLFSLIDHSGEAEKAGFRMPPTKLLIFGSPKMGTPVMLSAPAIALDLPLKLLVWQDSSGSTCISYNSPDYLRERYNVPEEFMKILGAASRLAEKASAS
jgi:uncharacterized protein (DUF302 family)